MHLPKSCLIVEVSLQHWLLGVLADQLGICVLLSALASHSARLQTTGWKNAIAAGDSLQGDREHTQDSMAKLVS